MKRCAFRLSLLLLMVGLAILASTRPVSASLGFCRTDPQLHYTTPDGEKHLLVLSLHLSLLADQVTTIAWAVDLPFGSNLGSVVSRGNVPETVSVTTNSSHDMATVSVDAQSTDTSYLVVDARDAHNPHSAQYSATGSTNQWVSLSVPVN
jgi:hypothetical protein